MNKLAPIGVKTRLKRRYCKISGLREMLKHTKKFGTGFYRYIHVVLVVIYKLSVT